MKISVVIPNYNNSSLITKCLDALINQDIESCHSFQITVVDDGSTDNSAGLISDIFGNRINLIKLLTNQGRSTARNIGAKSSDADYLIFIDSDCIPTDAQFIQSYLNAIQCGGELIFGQVTTVGDSFWNRLQRTSFINRLNEFNKGNKWVYTTQNVCIKKSLFMESGGFDLVFDKHGFEDRDLFIRLLGMDATCLYANEAKVIHEDAINLKSVAGKMQDAGTHVSKIFFDRHPEYYLKSHFSNIDCRIRPWLKLADILAWPLASRLIKSDNHWLENTIIPFKIRCFLARSLYGLAYLHGTTKAK